LEEYLSTQNEIWEAWFQRIQGQLSDDAATNLQRQIDAISYVYVLGKRAILGITASPVHKMAIFGPYGAVTGEKAIISAPSWEPNMSSHWVLSENMARYNEIWEPRSTNHWEQADNTAIFNDDGELITDTTN
jgi:hypothetical protein